MKILFAFIQVLIAIMWVNVQASPCQVYNCGSIGQSADANKTVCVAYNSGIDNATVVDTCDDDYECTAISWSSVGQARNATCDPIVDRPPADNTVIAGEFCSNTTQCFNHDNGANCTIQDTLGFCESPIAEGGACENDAGSPGHRYCPVNMYCKSSLCTKALNLKQVCTEDDLCQFGLACIKLENGTTSEFTCSELGSLENGVNFNIIHMVNDGDDWTGINSVCKSHSAFVISAEIRECRPGDKNIIENVDDLRQEGSTAMCSFQSFDAVDANATTPVSKLEYAKCGFNTESSAWCTKRKGDKWFVDTLENIRALDMSKFNCHPSSRFQDCYDSVNGVDEDLQWEFQKRLTEVKESEGFHLIAENDICVSESITRSYWQGRFPDGAYSSTLYSTLVLAVISAIMLML